MKTIIYLLLEYIVIFNAFIATYILNPRYFKNLCLLIFSIYKIVIKINVIIMSSSTNDFNKSDTTNNIDNNKLKLHEKNCNVCKTASITVIIHYIFYTINMLPIVTLLRALYSVEVFVGGVKS